MNKKEADTILLACKKHSITLTMRKEGDSYFVTFNRKFEICSFEAAKLITNGLVIESRASKIKKDEKNSDITTSISFTKYHKKKVRPEDGISITDRLRNA